MALPGDVNYESLKQANEVDATMLEEAAVFDRNDRIDHHFWNFVVFHPLALGALLGVKERGDQSGFEVQGGELAAANGDVIDFGLAQNNAGRVGAVIRLRGRH